MTLYKLTDQSMRTHNGYQWVLGEKRTAPGTGGLCSAGWLHAYEDPLVAGFMNPAHANIKDPRMFRCEGEIGLRDGDLKCGCTSLTLLEEMPLPEISTAARVRTAIYRAMMVHAEPSWTRWAQDWLSGADRSAWAGSSASAGPRAAEAAAWSASEAARALAWSASEAGWEAGSSASAAQLASSAAAGATEPLAVTIRRAIADEAAFAGKAKP